MDSTETHYINYDPKLIWEQAMYTYIAEGGDILYPGDAKEILLRSVLAFMVLEFGVVDNALRMDSLRFAMDDYLDIKGEKRYCYRMQAQEARAAVQITFMSSGISGTIPAGTAMTADGQRIYVTEADIEQTGFAQVTAVGIIAEEAGAAGNGLVAGTQMQLCAPNAAVQNIIVTASATGGRDRENDESYRARIEEYGLVSVTTGPKQQYEAAARAVSPEILDAEAVRVAPSEVCVYLVLPAESDKNALIAAVQSALSPADTRPLTDLVTVMEARVMPYTLNVRCTLDGTVSGSDLENIVSEYQAWQDNTISRPFNPDKLMSMLYQAGVMRVEWLEGSQFNGGAAVYTEIGKDERCIGTITLNCIS